MKFFPIPAADAERAFDVIAPEETLVSEAIDRFKSHYVHS